MCFSFQEALHSNPLPNLHYGSHFWSILLLAILYALSIVLYHKRYGVSMILSQVISKEDQDLLLQLYPRLLSGVDLDTLYSPTGIVFISPYPFIQEIKSVLIYPLSSSHSWCSFIAACTQLYSIYIHPSQSIPLLCYIYQLIYQTPCPSLGSSVIIQWSQTSIYTNVATIVDIIEFIRHKSRGLPYSSISLSPLLLTLSSTTILHFMNAILLEQKVFTSSFDHF